MALLKYLKPKDGLPDPRGSLSSSLSPQTMKVREGGGVVYSGIAMAAAKGILMSCDRSMLAEYGGHVNITKSWAFSLLKRMKFVQRKGTTLKSKFTLSNFAELKKSFLEDVVATVTMEEIPPELILNWDQTGIKIVPSSDFLPIQLIYAGKTNRCHPQFQFPSDWHITHAPKHWSNEETMLQYIDHIIVPYVENIRDLDTPALVIFDNFKGQMMYQSFWNKTISCLFIATQCN